MEFKEFKEVKDISLYIHWGKFSGTKHTSFFRFAQGNFSLNSFNSLLQHFSGISDFSCYGSGGGNQRRGEDGA